ncbi:MAG TPA: alpha/beta hydrolase [Chitinophagales bacterium]|nr:alpha/beta hydrolase [Chitinophagales bacterium]
MKCSIDFKGATGYYRSFGKGPVVMLVHGFIEEGAMWDTTAKALQKNYKVLVPDLPGFGASPLAKGHLPLSMELYAEYLLAILKQEKVKKLVLLGHSMGGYIALYFAEKYGSMLAGFGLVNSHCFEDSAQKKINRKKGIAFVKQHGTRVFVTELYNSIFHESFKKKNPQNRTLIKKLVAQALKYSPEAIMAANAAMMHREDKSEVLKNATVPVLFINGKDDESAPIAYTLKQAAYPKIADIHFFSNCKHMCVFERRRETIAAINGFCGLAWHF